MKGISALIASVLLIAFTVAVAGIISIFYTSFTSTTTSTVNSSTQVQVSCAGSTLSVSNSSPVIFKVSYDVGTSTLTSVNVTFIDQNGTSAQIICSPSSLTAGSLCVAISTVVNPVSVRARAVCQGAVPVIRSWP